MLRIFHLYFYYLNKLSELLPGDPENVVFLEDLVNQRLLSYRSYVVLIAKTKVNFDPSQNIFTLRFCIRCYYSYKIDPQVLENINVEVECMLTMALLEIFGGEGPISTENFDGWLPF